MNTAKHTPGPWKVDCKSDNECPGVGTADGCFSIVVIGFKDDERDDCGVDGDTREQELANAHLIASAPDLLAALKKAVERQGFTNAELITARAAIAKAEGRAE